MSVEDRHRLEIPRRGTRGVRMPRLPGPVMQLMSELIFRIYRKRRFMGFRVLRLTTTGARTGRERQTLLGYFDDAGTADAKIIVASAAGSARHPAWYFNLARHPDQVWIEVDDQKLRVTPELLRDDERAAAWRRIVAEAPAYAGYRDKTDREIPLIRLTPV